MRMRRNSARTWTRSAREEGQVSRESREADLEKRMKTATSDGSSHGAEIHWFEFSIRPMRTEFHLMMI
jgi:hypothetical protein